MFQLGTTVMNGSLHFSSEDLPPRAFTNYSYLFRPSRASYNGEKQKASHQEAWVPLLALPWASWLLGISDNSLRGRIEYCSGSQTWAILESPKEVGKKCKNPVLLPFQWVWASVGLFVYWIFFFLSIVSVLCFGFLPMRHVESPWPEIEPTPPAVEGKLLTIGPPGKSLD